MNAFKRKRLCLQLASRPCGTVGELVDVLSELSGAVQQAWADADLRELTPIEAERRRVEAEQNRRRKRPERAALNSRPAAGTASEQLLGAHQKRQGKVDAANDGYRPPESNVRLISAPHSWEVVSAGRHGPVGQRGDAPTRAPHAGGAAPRASCIEPPGGRALGAAPRDRSRRHGPDRARRAAAGDSTASMFAAGQPEPNARPARAMQPSDAAQGRERRQSSGSGEWRDAVGDLRHAVRRVKDLISSPFSGRLRPGARRRTCPDPEAEHRVLSANPGPRGRPRAPPRLGAAAASPLVSRRWRCRPRRRARAASSPARRRSSGVGPRPGALSARARRARATARATRSRRRLCRRPRQESDHGRGAGGAVAAGGADAAATVAAVATAASSPRPPTAARSAVTPPSCCWRPPRRASPRARRQCRRATDARRRPRPRRRALHPTLAAGGAADGAAEPPRPQGGSAQPRALAVGGRRRRAAASWRRCAPLSMGPLSAHQLGKLDRPSAAPLRGHREAPGGDRGEGLRFRGG